MRMLLSSASASAALAAFAVAAPAQAAPLELYGVEVDAVVETTYAGDAHTPTFEHTSSLALQTRLRAGFLAVVERDASGRVIGASGEDQHVATTTGAIETRERELAPDWNDWWERSTSCVGAGEAKNDEGRTSLRPDPLTPLVGASLILNLADKLTVDVDCADTGRNGGAGPRAFTLLSPVPDDEFGPTGPLAVSFDLPAEATAAGKTIQLFEGPAGGRATYCPPELAERAETTSCRVTFRGTVTLTRDRASGPGTPSNGGSGSGRAPAPVDDPRLDDLLAPLVPAKQQARLSRGATSLTFRAACASGCRGTAAIRVPAKAVARATGAAGAGARATVAARLRTLATVRVAVAKSASARTVRVAIPRKARRALLRSRGAVVALTLKGGGRTTKATLKLTR